MTQAEFYRIVQPYIEEFLQLEASQIVWKFGMIRISNEEFRTVEWIGVESRGQSVIGATQ